MNYSLIMGGGYLPSQVFLFLKSLEMKIKHLLVKASSELVFSFFAHFWGDPVPYTFHTDMHRFSAIRAFLRPWCALKKVNF